MKTKKGKMVLPFNVVLRKRDLVVSALIGVGKTAFTTTSYLNQYPPSNFAEKPRHEKNIPEVPSLLICWFANFVNVDVFRPSTT